VPFGPEIQYTGEKQADEITLYIYTGKDAEFTLYEDEGVNYNYERGEFNTIQFSYDDESGTLTIGKSNGKFDGMLNNRTFNIVWISKLKPVAFDLTAKPITIVNYDGKEVKIKRP